MAKLARLRHLDVGGTRITGSALAHVAGLRWLKELHTEDTAVRDRDLVHLERLKGLEWVGVTRTRVTKKGAEALQKKLKKTSVYR